MARKTKAEAERTRLRILKSALDLFVAKGFERTTFDDVARRIALTKGAVYWHFGSKTDLLAELIRHLSAEQTRQIGAALPQPVSLAALKEHFIAWARQIVSTPASRKSFYMLMRLDWPSDKFEGVKQQLREDETSPFFLIRRTLENLRQAGAVRADIDVSGVSSILGAMWIGLISNEVEKCLDSDLAQTIGFGFDSVIAAIRT